MNSVTHTSKQHRNYRGLAVFAATLIAGMLAWHPPAQAQINPFRGYKGPTLSRDDIDAGIAAAATLLHDAPVATGTFESWVGPKTGNNGTLMITKVYEHGGLPCRVVESRVVYKSTGSTRVFSLKACQVASGQWKLAD